MAGDAAGALSAAFGVAEGASPAGLDSADGLLQPNVTADNTTTDQNCQRMVTLSRGCLKGDGLTDSPFIRIGLVPRKDGLSLVGMLRSVATA